MRTTLFSALRGAVGLCLVLVFSAPRSSKGDTGPESGPVPEAAQRPPLKVRSGAATTYAYAPRDRSAPRPAVVYLHGRCGAAVNGCPHFASGVENFGWLVCPPATERCEGGGLSWSGPTSRTQTEVDRAVSAVEASFPGSVDVAAPTVLIGFSQGAYIAVEMAKARPGKYTGMFLIGAEIGADAATLNAAGVKRVVLAAGAYDGARPAMEAEAKKLSAHGFSAAFVNLGTVGHTYVADREGVLFASLQWLLGTGAAPQP